ncbi:hypothetical protein JHK87_001037 [Glycine soja]|nr:hypothetical protein JHK87_001037 [Glycine soja]
MKKKGNQRLVKPRSALGTQGLPLTSSSIPKLYLCKNTSLQEHKGPRSTHRKQKSRTDTCLVAPPQAQQTQGPPLVILASPKARKTKGTPLESLSKTQDGRVVDQSKGSQNPRSALSSQNPRFALGESRFSKGSSNPRSALGESRFSKGLLSPRSVLGESQFSKGSQNPRSTLGPPFVSLASPKAHKTQGPPFVSLTSPKARQTQGLPLVSLYSPKARKTQGLPLVSLAKIQDERIAGRFSKGSSNSRSALGESLFSKGLSNPRNIKIPRSALGTKTQGSPLVHTLTKPKAPLWSAHSLRTTTTTVKGLGSTRKTTTRLVRKSFNQVEVILTPHNHQGKSSAKDKETPPDE